jgi:flagellar biosynthesis protein FliR
MDGTLATGTLLLSLRLGPVFTLAPPFAQLNVPLRVRVVLVLSLAASLAAISPAAQATSLITASATELFLGMLLAFGFQAGFAGLDFAGRALDVQAGYGLALVIDPATHNQAPLFGTLLTLVASLVFFLANGHLELMRVLGVLTRMMPPGSALLPVIPAKLMAFLGTSMLIGVGAVAAPMVALFLVDVVIAYLSRALPQINALLLGLQVKTMVTLVVASAAVGLSGPVILRLIRRSLDFVPSLVTP